MQQSFIIEKTNLSKGEWINSNIPTDLKPDEILLKVHFFALTANNISYGITGEKLGYWHFFPFEENQKGIIPAWGFVEVVKSNHTSIKEGQRFYGFVPMAEFWIAKPEKISEFGFVDAAEHRKNLPAVYNFYNHTSNDILYKKETEFFQSIFRPLFITSFLLDDFLVENNFFDAENIILTSASSKTAFALAFLLKQRNLHNQNLIGLTSSKNNDFVTKLNLYQKVINYEQLESIENKKTCVVDFAGNQHLHWQIQEHFKENLVYNCLVGASHWEQTQTDIVLEKKGKFFFAPAHAQKRTQELGRVIFQEKIAKAWDQFVTFQEPSFEIENTKDKNIFSSTYQQLLKGNYPADKGFIFEF